MAVVILDAQSVEYSGGDVEDNTIMLHTTTYLVPKISRRSYHLQLQDDGMDSKDLLTK